MARVRAALRAVNGVQRVDVDFDAKQATVTGSGLDSIALAEAVRRAGYPCRVGAAGAPPAAAPQPPT